MGRGPPVTIGAESPPSCGPFVGSLPLLCDVACSVAASGDLKLLSQGGPVCVARALAPGPKTATKIPTFVVGDAVMGSYDGQRAAAHVRAFAAKAEWAPA